MRFRATLAPEQVAHLYALVSPLAKVSSQCQPLSHGSSSQKSGLTKLSSWASHTCLLSLDSEMMRISLDLPPTEGMTCVAEAQVSRGLFSDHRIESNAANNQIVLRVDLVQLRTALQSIQQQIQTKKSHNNRSASAFFATGPATLTVLKLAKRQGMPCLCLEAKTAYRMEMHQTIPVEVQRPDQTPLGLPELPAAPAVQLWLPPTAGSTLKALLDAVKQPAKGQTTHILITGHATTAELRLRLQHDNGVQLQTLFLGQTVPVGHTRDGQEQEQQQQQATVRVSAAQVACTLNHGNWTTEWSWIPNEALVVSVRLDPCAVCTYVLPVHYLEEDGQDEDANNMET